MTDSLDSSPLWMIADEPALNSLINALESIRPQLDVDNDQQIELYFSQSEVEQAREGFSRMIRSGEAYLHALCELLCDALFSDYRLSSVVVGEVGVPVERFTHITNLSKEELYSSTDLDLGNRQLKRLKIQTVQGWVTPRLVSNVVEYQPLKHNQFGIHKVLSRIKAEEEIWNKVVDELFRLDELVSRDKELRHLSRYVKDVFGIKMVVSRAEDIEGLFEYMSKLAWSAEQLKNLNVSKDQDLSTLTVLEVKNYSPKGFQKESNWQALKVVFQWAGRTFEIQIQPLEVYHLEKEVLTQESHEGFKTRRERIRDDVAAQYPLFQFYRQLLRWLFENPGSEAPRYRNVKVLMR